MNLAQPHFLQLHGVSKSFGGIRVVNNVSCGIRRGSITGLIGPNGAGKTTLLDIISGLCHPDQGQIVVDGVDITSFSPGRRGRVGLARVFQGIRIFGSLTLLQNVSLAAGGSAEANDATISAAVDFFGRVVGHSIADDQRPAAEVGYAAQKMLPIAMAIARAPRLLLLDEPTVGLDFHAYNMLMREVRAIAASGTCVVLVEHNLDVMRDLTSSILFLAEGRLLKEGSFDELTADDELRRTYFGV